MKKFVLVILSISFIFILSSCGANRGTNDIQVEPQTPSNVPSQEYKGSEDRSITESSSLKQQRKIIQNAHLNLEVQDPAGANNAINDEVARLGGYISNSSKTETKRGLKIYIEIRLPSQKLNDFIKYFDNIGKVKDLTISTEEITSDYYDVKARLENALNQRQKLFEIMEQAKTIDEILKVQKEIDTVQERIEKLQGQIKLWDNLVDFSTVRVDIIQDPKAFKSQNEPKLNPFSFTQWWSYIKNGFIGVLNFMIVFFQWVVIILVDAAIPLAIVIIIFLIIMRIKNRRKSKEGGIKK